MIKVALLSRWHVHADDYARDIQENEDISIQLVWDEESDRGEKWAEELGVPFEQDLNKVLSNSNIDAVIVNTPTNKHKEIIIAAAKHKKHIFTEKVLAFTVKDCEEIYQAVHNAGVELMVSLPRLTDNNFLYAEKSIKDGWVGKVTMVRCRFAHNGAVAPEGQEYGWLPERFFNLEQAGGGAMIDLGAHPIYLTNRLAGKVKGVYARLQTSEGFNVDDNAALLIDYDSGALGVIETSFVSHGSPFQLEVYGTEGTLRISDDQITVNSIHVNNNKQTEMSEALTAPPMPMVQWIRQIKSGETPTITKEDIMNLTLINEAASKSNKEGRRIDIEKGLS
ncbi:Gfo/Idh/MocA family protein [Oceanobacillus manasiensis]|uniref:Gfo/Idh/MocA family protein n=1 Tax=Oceanobacillus manasiensis TaxID=586413 RepID=UPI0005A9148E|nr:Gfo/Idh/MocA family oxidoreductase [Oceanobacillus manasiensis]